MAKAKKIIFSIPEASIVKYATKEAFCEDALGTVWCDDEFYFNYVSPIISWGEIYIIFVNSPQKGDYKLLLIRSENQSRQFYYYASGAQGSITTSGDIINNEKFINELNKLIYSKPDYLVEKIKMFVTGRVDDSIFDSLPFLDYVNIKEPLGTSELVFDFSDNEDEVVALFGLEEWDLSHITCALSYDKSCDIGEDPLYLKDELFASGEVILANYFPRDNQAHELIKKIYYILNPNLDTNNWNEVESRKANSFLTKTFPSEMLDFFESYVKYHNKATYGAMKERVLVDLEKIKKMTGIVWNPVDGTVKVQLGDIFIFLIESDSSHDNFIDVLGKYFENQTPISGYNEDRYDFVDNRDYYYDYEALKNEVLPILQSVYNKLNTSKFRESINIYNLIGSNLDYRLNFTNPTTNEKYRVDKIDPESGTISFTKAGMWMLNQYTMTNQEFTEWMTNEKLKLESQNVLLSLQQILSDDSRKNRLT